MEHTNFTKSQLKPCISVILNSQPLFLTLSLEWRLKHVKKIAFSIEIVILLSVQVETIRDAYMVVAGVPNKTTFHAHHICDMALDMLSSIDHLKDPSTGDNIQIRVGEQCNCQPR